MNQVANTMVTSNVRLKRLLGEGGMGSVWVADHLALKTEVAVKFLQTDVVRRNPTMLGRFEREASAAAQIKSPHVVTTFDSGVMDDNTPYIVMELLEGESLAARVIRAGPLCPDDVSVVLSQTAKALHKAHKLGIVHRDIKPDNLFLVGSGQVDADDEPAAEELFVKVLDFGIAKQTQAVSHTHSGAMFGTPLFMSPEMLMSTKNVDEQADLWALAVVGYLALTARTPFQRETLGAIIMAVNEGKFPPPSHLEPTLPPIVDAFFTRAFDLDRDKRFGSAQQLAAAFAQTVAVAGTNPGQVGATDGGEVRPVVAEAASVQTSDGASTCVIPPDNEVPHQGVAQAAADSSASREVMAVGVSGAQASSLYRPIDGSAPEGSQPAVSAAGTFGPASSTLAPAGLPRSKVPLFALLATAGVLLAAGASVVVVTSQGDSTSAGRDSDSASELGTRGAPTTKDKPPAANTEPADTASAEATSTADAEPAPTHSSRPQALAESTAKPKTEPPKAVPAATPKPKPSPKPNCNPSYWIDGKGIRHYKPECL